MSKPKRVHLDDTESGSRVSQALCTWTAVDTTTDLTQVTCHMCLHKLRGTSPVSTRNEVARAEIARVAAEAYAKTLIPKAPAPPVLTAPVYATVCRSHERRCGCCVVCEHESQMRRYDDPREPKHARDCGRRSWTSLSAALVALSDWEKHNRAGRSACGPILDRIESGEIGDGGRGRVDDRLMVWADDVVHVRQALEAAYPENAHPLLSAQQCRALLMTRTPGILSGPMPTFEALAEELCVSAGELKALVRSGRDRVTVELAGRGMIPDPKPQRGLFERIARWRKRLVGA